MFLSNLKYLIVRTQLKPHGYDQFVIFYYSNIIKIFRPFVFALFTQVAK